MKLTNAQRYCFAFLRFRNLLNISRSTHGLHMTKIDDWITWVLFNQTPCEMNRLYGYSIFCHPINQQYNVIMYTKRPEYNARFIGYDDLKATKKDYDYFQDKIANLKKYDLWEMKYFHENPE